MENEQVRIHESTVACDWAGAVMPKNNEKNEILDILHIFENLTFLKILDIFENFGHFWTFLKILDISNSLKIIQKY